MTTMLIWTDPPVTKAKSDDLWEDETAQQLPETSMNRNNMNQLPEMNESIIDLVEPNSPQHYPDAQVHDVMVTQQLPVINEMELDQDIMELLDQVSGSSHANRDDGQPFRQMLFLDDVQPNEVQTQYLDCFRPGTNNHLFQSTPQTTSESQTDYQSQPQSTQTNYQTQAQSTQTQHETYPSVGSQTDETVPGLINSHDYIRSLNALKNNMIHTLLKDNIAMTKARLLSRQKALEAIEKEFDVHMPPDTDSFDESSMMLFSKLLQLKEQFISKLLSENIATHPAHYELYQLLTQLK